MHYSDGLETTRLITRFVTPDDVATWVAYCSDPECTRFTAIPDKTPEEMAQAYIDFTLKRYAEHRYGLQALIDKETGAFIGQCGLLLQEVNGQPEIEVGYHLLRKYHGMGYASEAAQMFRDYGFAHHEADSIISIIDPMNFASKKVAARNGMRLTETVNFSGKPHEIFRITKHEWETLCQPT